MQKLLQSKQRPMEFFRNPACPVGDIYQAKWEFSALLDIYLDRKPQRVLEVGSMFGGSLWHWFQTSPQRLVAIDALVHPDDGRYHYHVEAHSNFYGWAAQQSGTWFSLIEGDSRDPGVIAQVAGEEFDFLFIDGDHSYESAKSDLLSYGPLVKEGGIIAMHDILPSPHWPGIQVFKLWKEIQEAGYVTQELLSSHDQMLQNGTFGIGVIYV